jgi:hypothetical protein
MSKLSDNLQEIHIEKRQYIKNWKDEIPQGSLWEPGSRGDPACQICLGTGWVRFDVYPGHPKFGKLSVCTCVKEHAYHQQRVDFENSPAYRPTPKPIGR